MFFLMKLCQNFLWASSFVLQKKKKYFLTKSQKFSCLKLFICSVLMGKDSSTVRISIRKVEIFEEPSSCIYCIM